MAEQVLELWLERGDADQAACLEGVKLQIGGHLTLSFRGRQYALQDAHRELSADHRSNAQAPFCLVWQLIDAREQPSVIVSIHDTGPGVRPEHLPKLFERFFRIDRGRNRAQGGSGLGLAIAQSIATAHGGRLEVVSTIGQGSTFTAILPCAIAPDDINARSPRRAAKSLIEH